MEGGVEEPVLASVHDRNWVVTEQGVYVLQMQAGGTGLYGLNQPADLIFYDFRSKRAINTGFRTPRRVGNNGMAVTPDGKYLIFPQLEQLGSDIMLVEHFR